MYKKSVRVGVISYNQGMEKRVEEEGRGSSMGTLEACFSTDGIQGPVRRE